MKLRISSYKTALVKDLLRFAPVWALYLVAVVMLLFTVLVGRSAEQTARNLEETIAFFSVSNLIYAALCAQLLFGDLFQTRLCNALHAMPLKRSEWFFCHVAAGLCFSLVPNTIVALGLLPVLDEFWFVSFFWMAGMTLEFVFFFGLAVLSVFCAGNRLGMVTVYGILNFLAVLVLWFAKTVFEPMIYGLYVSGETFALFSPVVRLVGWEQTYLCFEKISGTWRFTGLGDSWGYLLILGGAGVAFGALGLLLYCRRALETAGDFIAVRFLMPVFCVVYTLTVAVLFAEFGNVFLMDYSSGFFAVGFVVGYLTGQMLLHRTLKIFTKRIMLGFAIFVVVTVSGVGLVRLDPTGYAYWVPDPEKVQSVSISGIADVAYREDWLTLDAPEDIAAIVAVHQDVTEKLGQYPADKNTVQLSLRYVMKNGREVIRVYEYGVPAEAVSDFFSRPEYVLDYTGDPEAFIDSVLCVELDGEKVSGKPAKELLRAMIADCEAGTMVQDWAYHDTKAELHIMWASVLTTDGYYRDVNIFSGAENTVSWLKENFDLWADENRKYDDYFTGK